MNIIGQHKKINRLITRTFIVFVVTLMTAMTLMPLGTDAFTYAKESDQQTQDVTNQSEQTIPDEVEATEDGVIEDSTNDQMAIEAQGETKTEYDEEQAYAEEFSGLTYEGGQYNVALDYGKAAAIPEGTTLTAKEIAAKTKSYKQYSAKALQAVQKNAGKTKIDRFAFAKFYDITLTDEDGNEVEPSAPVDVNIQFDKKLAKELVAKDASNLSVIHFVKDKDGAVKAQVLGTDQDKNNNGVAVVDPKTGEGEYLSESKGGDYPVELGISNDQLQEVTFTADSFSVYAVVYTVDFHYGDGEYDFSIAGESSILLSDVFARLKIDTDIADVEDVAFSDESLVKVEKVNKIFGADDWKLTSLKPFDTEEMLTVALNDGSVIAIRVTDAQTTEGAGDAVIKVESNGVTKYFTTFADIYGTEGIYRVTTNNFANRDASVTITFLKDYTMTFADVAWNFVSLRNGNLTINGGGHTISAADGLSDSLVKWNYSGNGTNGNLTIQNITINGSYGTIIERSGSGALTINSATINGGNTDASLIKKNDGGGNIIVTGGSINRANSTGNLITDSGTGYIAIRSMSINGSNTQGLSCNSHILEKTGNGAIYLGNNQNISSESGVFIIGGNTTGNLIQRTTSGLITLTKATITGAESGNGAAIYNAGANNVTIQENSKIYRGKSTGSAVVNNGGGQLIITSSTISGAKSALDSTSVSATKPLVKQGTGAVTLTNATIEKHVASTDGVCAVDASAIIVAGGVKVSGNTSITGNKADGKDANLSVTGATVLQIPAASTLGGTVGVTTTNKFNGSQFATLGNAASRGGDHFKNDIYPTMEVVANGLNLFWAERNSGAESAVKHGNYYYYKGLEYSLDDSQKTAIVHKYDTNNYSNWSGTPVIVDSVPYGDWMYAVTDITYFGTAATLRNKNLLFEDDMLEKMANGAAIGLPDIATEFSQAIKDAVDGYTAGQNNSENPGSMNVWKKATLDPENNVIEYSLKYLQMLEKDQPLDFIFGVDQSGTMCTNDATANGVKAPRVMWMMALLQKTSYELVSKNNSGYDNKVAFVPWGATATPSSFMNTKPAIDTWFTGSTAYAHADEGTDHGNACNALVSLANQSMNNNHRRPIVIYMSDFVSHAGSSDAERAALRGLPCPVYGFVVFNSGRVDYAQRSDGWANAGAYESEDPGEFMNIFSKIIKEALGYYLNVPLVVTDNLSSSLNSMTPVAGTVD